MASNNRNILSHSSGGRNSKIKGHTQMDNTPSEVYIRESILCFFHLLGAALLGLWPHHSSFFTLPFPLCVCLIFPYLTLIRILVMSFKATEIIQNDLLV